MDEMVVLLSKLVTGTGKTQELKESHIAALINHGLAPLAAYRGQEEQQLLRERYKTTASHLAREQTLSDLDELFKNEGIKAIVLKGASVAFRYWPEADLRPSCDLDLLLKAKDKGGIAKTFGQLGYELISETDSGQKWQPPKKGRAPLDVVYSMRAPGAINPTYQIDENTLWRKTVERKEGSSLLLLSPSHLLIHCAVHAADHTFSRLLWLADLAFIFQKEKELCQSEEIFRLAAKVRASRVLRLALRLAIELFLPDHIGEAPEIPWGTKWFQRQLCTEPCNWGDAVISPRMRKMMRACLVDRPQDLLRAAVGLPAR